MVRHIVASVVCLAATAPVGLFATTADDIFVSEPSAAAAAAPTSPAASEVAAVPAVPPAELHEEAPASGGLRAALRGSATGSTVPHGHPSATKDYPKYEGFSLWLVEEFDEALDLNHDPIWTWSDGGLGEGQVRFTKENLVFEDGKLKIKALNNGKAADPQPQQCSYAETEGNMPPKPLTSGEMRTKHNMFRYGLYQVRMKAPSVQPGKAGVDGNYISTMFAYRDAKFNHWREIDVEVTGDTARSLTMNLLNAEKTEAWSPKIQATQTFTGEAHISVREDFHTFGFAWLPTGVTWYFDGKVVGKHGPGDKLPVPELSTKIMMNLWIFNDEWGFGGPEGDNNRYPMQSEYDWFRFYKWDGDTSYPCADGTDSCLTADDKYLSANNPCDGIPQVGQRNGKDSCVAKCPY